MTHGYYFTVNNKGYFYKTETQRKTANVIKAIIEFVGTYKNRSRELIDRAKNDNETIKDFRRLISAASLEKRTADDGTEYIRIWIENGILNWPVAEFEKTVIVF